MLTRWKIQKDNIMWDLIIPNKLLNLSKSEIFLDIDHYVHELNHTKSEM